MMSSDDFYEMLENVQRGVDIKLAMKAFGISKKDLEPWQKKEMVKAKAMATISMQQVIHEHGSLDWRAMQWIIERNHKRTEDGKQIELAINKQIAKEVAKGLIESGLAGEVAGLGGNKGVQEGESEDDSYSPEPSGILFLPRNKTESPTDGDI